MGGTGHIGSAIARKLATDGWTVTAAGRSAEPRPNLEGTKVKIVGGDDHQPAAVAGWIADADLVVDAATPYPLWLHDRDRVRIVANAVTRARHLTAMTARSGAAFVHISSFTTLPRPKGPIAQLSQGILQGLHSYFDLKAKVEAAVRGALRDGLRGCVVNPATCFGPYDLKPMEHAFIPMLLAGKVGGLVRHDLNVVDVRDVAAVVSAACAQDFPTSQIPVFGHTVSLPELATRICQLGGVNPPRLQVPSLMGLASLYWVETAYAVAGRKSPWPSLPMMLVRASYAAAPSAAQISLAGHPRPLADTLQDAVAWYRKINRV
ncbi:NAD-dependent epimerase/dehydratase family protein [Sulfitobacter aestuariivivens]|uniref:NAD-dependent epimerase/dehydratase family protein n=1 Tax=Sulfitobacter aestuariivivens TaxID=2766981 RepID=UPI001C20EE3A|nr:NAD-dependent epimerase/dehydratase family protein [Sulfitobacter aestuariivivens]